MKRDHRGITLVELLIAISISAIIMAAAAFFFMTAQKNYREAAASVDVQSETQILMEQIGTWIMEGNRVEIEADKLIIYHIPDKITLTNPASKRIIWLSSAGKLYMKQFENIADPDMDASDIDMDTDEVEQNCIGEYVTEFEADKEDAKVTISMEMSSGHTAYSTQNTFKVRNILR